MAHFTVFTYAYFARSTGVDPGADGGTGHPKYGKDGTLISMSPPKFLPVQCICAHVVVV